ncbi:MAG: DUF86 domain-containing protein [Anaerolineae bacterium]|nr:DUF86 domain-containing protein [Anaerolineae bacterium]NIQ77740.1 DUF86 domain-containing protein [Anaerolineae bacterium]
MVYSMVDPELLASRIGKTRSYLEKLRILAAIPLEEFLQDFTKVESAKHLLQVSIESCLDIAHHIVADEGYRTPADYYDTFVVLNEKDILPESFMPTLRQMVRFRNRVVHLYWDVDDTTVYHILQENLNDFETFIGYILDFTQ